MQRCCWPSWAAAVMMMSASDLQGRRQPGRPSVRPWGGSAFSPDPRRDAATRPAHGTHGTRHGTRRGTPHRCPLSLSSTGSVCNICPEEWIYFQKKCYYFGEGTKKWIQARNACSKLHGRLVSIRSQEEQVGLGSAGRTQIPALTSCVVVGGGPRHISPALSCSPGLPDQTLQQEGLLDWPSGPGHRGGVHLDGQ